MRDWEKLQSAVRDFIARESLLEPRQRVLVAASGGLDSSVLADILHALAYPVALAHVNYRLRGKDSAADAAGVAAQAKRIGCPVHTITATLPTPPPAGFNLQAWARQLRYDYFKKILDEYNYDVLATAHQLNDNVETFLLNLIHGMGAAGTRGIPLRVATPLPVVRPLLESSREEILAYARSRGLPWREDTSNATDAYRRNRLRHHVIPALIAEGLAYPSLRTTFRNLRSAERLQARYLTEHPAIRLGSEGITVQKGLLPPHPDDQLSLLYYLAGPRGFTREQCRQLLSAERNFTLSTGEYEARVDRDVIVMRESSGLAPQAVIIRELPAEVSWQSKRYFFHQVPAAAPTAPGEVLRCRVPGFPLHLRPRQKFDAIIMSGMGGHRKKVKDLLIDAKVPAWDRDRVPILTEENGNLIAVIGLRVAEEVALNGSEEMVLTVCEK